jgi:transposase
MYNITGFAKPELVELVAHIFEYLRDHQIGFPAHICLTPVRQIYVCLTYLRRNRTQADIAETEGVSQSTISRVVCEWTPILAAALACWVPTGEDIPGGVVLLVDGTFVPSWSWKTHPEDYSGKHRTTGRNLIVASTLEGRLAYVSDPFPGKTHDMEAIRRTSILETPKVSWIADLGFVGDDRIMTPIRRLPGQTKLDLADAEFNRQVRKLRAPAERANAQLKTWRILHTDYRRPHHTHPDTISAVLGLEFYRMARE